MASPWPTIGLLKVQAWPTQGPGVAHSRTSHGPLKAQASPTQSPAMARPWVGLEWALGHNNGCQILCRVCPCPLSIKQAMAGPWEGHGWAMPGPWVGLECGPWGLEWAMPWPWVGLEWAITGHYWAIGESWATINGIQTLSRACPCLIFVQSLSNGQWAGHGWTNVFGKSPHCVQSMSMSRVCPVSVQHPIL